MLTEHFNVIFYKTQLFFFSKDICKIIIFFADKMSNRVLMERNQKGSSTKNNAGKVPFSPRKINFNLKISFCQEI